MGGLEQSREDEVEDGLESLSHLSPLAKSQSLNALNPKPKNPKPSTLDSNS